MTISERAMRPIEARSVSEQVTDEIRRSILAGTLEPGQSLSLRTIAERLNVSFIPVRDALVRLQNEGLVVNPAGRSARVAELDLDELDAIYRLRRMLEPDLARRSCPALTDPQLDSLFELATSLGAYERSMDDIYDDHRSFHLALLAPAASGWDERILMTLWRASERYIRIGFGLLDRDPEEHDRRRVAHQTLVDVFRERDPERAAAAVEEHLAHNEEIAASALRGR